jgi:hypothetical protein
MATSSSLSKRTAYATCMHIPSKNLSYMYYLLAKSRTLQGCRTSVFVQANVCDEYCHETIHCVTLYVYSLLIISVLVPLEGRPAVTSPLQRLEDIVYYYITSTSRYI